MNILISGGSGFIGSHLIKKILETTDWSVISLDNLNYSGNLNRLSYLAKNFEGSRIRTVFHDLRAEINETTKKIIGSVDYIVHMAAKPHVDQSIKDPLSTVMHNVVGTCNILNYAKDSKVKGFVYFSTDEVFGNAQKDQYFDEYSRYNCRNPYSASKAGGEELTSAFFHSYNLPAKVVHCNNVYGEMQQSKAFIPICIGKLLRDEELVIHSDSSGNIPTRKYVYVEDVCDAILKILTFHTEQSRIPKYNIVSNEEVSILDLAQDISQILRKNLKYSISKNARVGIDIRYSISGELIKSLGWQQKNLIKDALPKVVNWFKSNIEWL